MINPLALVSIPADVVATLRTLPRMADRLDEIARHTAELQAVRRAIEGVSSDTSALQKVAASIEAVEGHTSALERLDDRMGEMSRATDVLPGMDERMATIESAMPTLVAVQQHLAQLPETMQMLHTGITGLTVLIERMLGSLEELDRDLDKLDAAVTPLGKLADRLPGGRR